MTRTGIPLCFSSAATSSPAQLRHLDVGDEDLRPDLLHRAQRFVAVAGARDDLDVVFHFQQRRQRSQNHRLIFRDDYPNLVAPGARHVLSFAERRPPEREANE